MRPSEIGVVTRGVLLDIARCQGKEWLEAGEGVFSEDLEAVEKAQGVRVEKAQGVRVEEGDALFVRMGWYKRRQQLWGSGS